MVGRKSDLGFTIQTCVQTAINPLAKHNPLLLSATTVLRRSHVQKALTACLTYQVPKIINSQKYAGVNCYALKGICINMVRPMEHCRAFRMHIILSFTASKHHLRNDSCGLTILYRDLTILYGDKAIFYRDVTILYIDVTIRSSFRIYGLWFSLQLYSKYFALVY